MLLVTRTANQQWAFLPPILFLKNSLPETIMTIVQLLIVFKIWQVCIFHSLYFPTNRKSKKFTVIFVGDSYIEKKNGNIWNKNDQTFSLQKLI